LASSWVFGSTVRWIGLLPVPAGQAKLWQPRKRRLAQIRVLCESAVLSERLSLSAQPSGEAAGGELQMTA